MTLRKVSLGSEILFVSQEPSADTVREALGTGARGYIFKMDARRELLEGVNAVLRGKRFVGRRFSGHDFDGTSHVSLRAEGTFRLRPDRRQGRTKDDEEPRQSRWAAR